MWRVHCLLVAVATKATAAGVIGVAAGVDVEAVQADGGDHCAITHHLQFSRSVSFVHGAEFISTASHPVVSHGCNTTRSKSYNIRKSRKRKNIAGIRSPTANSPSLSYSIVVVHSSSRLALSHSLYSFAVLRTLLFLLFPHPFKQLLTQLS